MRPGVRSAVSEVGNVSRPRPPLSRRIFRAGTRRVLSSRAVIPSSGSASFRPVPIAGRRTTFLLTGAGRSTSRLAQLVCLLSGVMIGSSMATRRCDLRRSCVGRLLDRSSISAVAFLLRGHRLNVVSSGATLLFSSILRKCIDSNRRHVPLSVSGVSGRWL